MASSTSAAQSAEFSSPLLAQALEAGDPVAVALALRNDRVMVPLLTDATDATDDAAASSENEAQVRVFRRGEADKYMLLLFSSVEAYVAMLPEETDHQVVAYRADDLRAFLETNRGVLESVWFDVAGPHTMQASPDDILDALTLS
ncbi:SseB family protein [Salinibacterium sp. NSLL150]|uniref:SseB family protein n=1 Tax=unclassified Salinibacterium TaxID=2632331 RepID=UPI0018CDA954|nr:MULTISPECIES: SseB family protein [unclassified Salinibacterium]MBH0098133.1 SseB family protein [Salinibacterium sp. NSLL35]MBH0100888.1 SseB family protein [Salinibacterium sp. NSLL150]MBH0103647.1 SseB family protein [Salinibacterium sp. NSLL16]MBH0106408.1 SseB family protein [Salinibacterium sp. NSLL17]MBH0109827.1 SseB family protein [Salinibacterium sp. NG22]